MISRRHRALGFLAAFLVQTALLAWLVGDRALLLANGREIRLAAVPVDPRDLLRGDYVVLAYDVSRLDAATLEGDDDFVVGEAIYVSLAPDGEVWRAVGLHRAEPEDGGPFIRGRVTSETLPSAACPEEDCSQYRVDYGLERFFVPEGEGTALETLREDERLSVDVAVGSDGRAALKRLRVDGAVRFEEPLL